MKIIVIFYERMTMKSLFDNVTTFLGPQIPQKKVKIKKFCVGVFHGHVMSSAIMLYSDLLCLLASKLSIYERVLVVQVAVGTTPHVGIHTRAKFVV